MSSSQEDNDEKMKEESNDSSFDFELLGKAELTTDNSPESISRTQEEIEQYLNIDSERQQAELEDLKQNIEMRRGFAFMSFNMIVVWLITIGVIIFLQGFTNIKFGRYPLEIKFNLSENVLIALITTTTATVAAFFLGVIKYLFPSNNNDTK